MKREKKSEKEGIQK